MQLNRSDTESECLRKSAFEDGQGKMIFDRDRHRGRFGKVRGLVRKVVLRHNG
jgi:hypothetical protein